MRAAARAILLALAAVFLVLLLALLAGPVRAAIVAQAEGEGGAVVLLHDDAGPCVGAALRAEFLKPGDPPIPGCWRSTAGGAGVLVVFFDGDVVPIHASLLRPPKKS